MFCHTFTFYFNLHLELFFYNLFSNKNETIFYIEFSDVVVVAAAVVVVIRCGWTQRYRSFTHSAQLGAVSSLCPHTTNFTTIVTCKYFCDLKPPC